MTSLRRRLSGFFAILFAVAVVAVVTALGVDQPVGASGLTCDDFPTQIDVAGSDFGQYDPKNFDENEDGVGCEANHAPPVAYDLTQTPPTPIIPPTTTAPTTTVPVQPPPVPPAVPAVTTPDFTG